MKMLENRCVLRPTALAPAPLVTSHLRPILPPPFAAGRGDGGERDEGGTGSSLLETMEQPELYLHILSLPPLLQEAVLAQLGERQTEVRLGQSFLADIC